VILTGEEIPTAFLCPLWWLDEPARLMFLTPYEFAPPFSSKQVTVPPTWLFLYIFFPSVNDDPPLQVDWCPSLFPFPPWSSLRPALAPSFPPQNLSGPLPLMEATCFFFRTFFMDLSSCILSVPSWCGFPSPHPYPFWL